MDAAANSALSIVPHGRMGEPRERTEVNPKWIRGYVGGALIVDSNDSRFVWEVPYYPQWYFPASAINAELRRTEATRSSDVLGEAAVFDLVVSSAGPDAGVDEVVLPEAAWAYEDSPIEAIRELVRIDFAAMDRWTEEEVEVIVHPRSPYVRIDVLPSTRRVEVSIDGVVVASTERASILYETGLPPRFYMPIDDVAPGVLSPSSSSTACPYKGVSRYWNVTADGVEHHDLMWGYDDPLPESALIKDLVCFYNEKVDLAIDGQPIAQPTTKFS